MDLLHDTETIEDLSALAWVHDELRRSMETAHKAMRRYLKDAEAAAASDIDAVDPAVLRAARSQLHQGVGALELVGLPTAAQVLRASEGALQKLTSSRPIKLDAAAVEAIEQASFALLDYLARQLAGKAVSPLALFPQYRAVQELAGADRIHPADLWPHDWQWRDIPAEDIAPRTADAVLRGEVESRTLDLMRQGSGAPARALSELFAALGVGATHKTLGALWRIAAAFFEAQGQKLLVPDVYSKRMASRLLAQLRLTERAADAPADVSQRLAQDLLFFCAQATSPGAGKSAPRLAAVRQAWNLARRAPVDYLYASLGKHDPASIVQAKKRVGAAKEGWAAVAGGESHRLNTLNEQFALVGESLRRLYPSGDQLATALADAAAKTVSDGATPAPALAMEVATAVLYLEASLEDADFDHPSQAERVQRLAGRLARVRSGAQPEPLDAWMEELYRRVSDRQTMGSVVQELKSALAEAEKAIDLYFRSPAKRELLHPVPAQLDSMRGVFSVLGLDPASQAVVRMRDDVDVLAAAAEDVPQPAATERLASNLGALGFLIDMLNVQPAMAKSLFAFDAKSGQLRSVAAGGVHRASGFGLLDGAPPAAAPVEPRLIEQAQSLAMAAAHPEVPLTEVRIELERLSQEAMVVDQPELAETMQQVKSAFEVASNEGERQAVREELAQAMADFVHTSSQPAALDDYPATRPMPEVPQLSSAPTPAGQTGLEDDAEMREIFLEEAREVVGNAEAALGTLGQAADDLGEMTTVRRAFHTLKGSARMVGLADFGEAAWACEQLYNARLADQQGADAPLLALTQDLLAYLGDWVDAIGGRGARGHASRDVQRAIARYKTEGTHGALPLPGTAAAPGLAPLATPTMDPVTSPMALDLLPELPDASELDLVPAASRAIQSLEALLTSDTPAVEFELDLGEAARMQTGGREAMQSLAAPEREADAPAPDLSSGLMSLDFDPSQPAPLEAIAAPPPAAPEAVRGPMSLATEPEPLAEPQAEPQPLPDPEADNFRMVGPLRVAIPLFNIFLNEADEQSRRLATELAEWSHDLSQPVGDAPIALSHSLAGNSATVGFAELSQLARSLEHALMRSQAVGSGEAAEAQLFNLCADEIRRLLHQFAAGFLKSPTPELLDRLADHERESAERLHAASMRAELVDSSADSAAMALDATGASAPPVEVPIIEVAQAVEVIEPEPMPQPEVPQPPASVLQPLGRAEYHALSALAPLTPLAPVMSRDALRGDDDIDAVDAVDAELFPIFQEEALELLPQLASRMRDWAAQPSDPAGATACMRTLHTLKGGARLAGAMRLGELAHRLESAIEHLLVRENPTQPEVEALFGRVDAIRNAFEALVAGPGFEPMAETRAAFEAPVEAVLPAPVPLAFDARVEAAVAESEPPITVARSGRHRARDHAGDPDRAAGVALGPARDRLAAFRRRRRGRRPPRRRPHASRQRAGLGAHSRAAARPTGQPRRRGVDRALAHRKRSRAAEGIAGRPD